MKSMKWSMAVAAEYNRSADVNLGYFTAGDPRWALKLARRVAQPAIALIEFVYAEPPLLRESETWLAAVRAYTPRGVDPAAIMPTKATSPRRDVGRLQHALRSAIAGLILRPALDDPENPSGVWTLPMRFEATIRCERSSAYGLGPDLNSVKPRWVADAVRPCSVLADALPWLRFCGLCGRLFFKVKRQRLCPRQRCKAVFHARRRSAEQRKTHRVERRGRPRVDYVGPIEAQHTAWIRATSRPARPARAKGGSKQWR